ncbi:MAG: 50S ribosomal protein L10 [Deltaproteobacteria bacterium]
MKKSEKEQFVADLNERLKEAKGTFLVDYQGLDVESINRLRGELRKAEIELRVVKNRLLKIASRETETEVMKDSMVGPSAVAISYDDVVAPAKTFVEFSKDFKQLKIKCGQISGKFIDESEIKRLAALPGREALLAQVLSAMQGVPAGFVRVLSGTLSQLMNVLKAIEQEKAAEN